MKVNKVNVMLVIPSMCNITTVKFQGLFCNKLHLNLTRISNSDKQKHIQHYVSTCILFKGIVNNKHLNMGKMKDYSAHAKKYNSLWFGGFTWSLSAHTDVLVGWLVLEGFWSTFSMSD